MRGIITFFFLASSIFQLFACIAGVNYAFDMGGFVSFILAIIFNWIPFVGALFGISGAHNVWHWGLLTSILLFIWPTLLTFAIAFSSKRNRGY